QAEHGGQMKHKGRGIMQGLECVNGQVASRITELAFKRGLIIETSGSDGQVVKILTPLTIEDKTLNAGLDILAQCIGDVMAEQISKASGSAACAGSLPPPLSYLLRIEYLQELL